ncbi:uncharacterized protein [Halyomorpha halys]|uniref:uncharacterized protein n=1 Tax=Halyomorpha halys TaxID=286706 RepID=UPI0006D4FF7F|nr:LDL receptor repeat-containing protein egg-1-like [Halyomorpha halys]
MCNLFLIQLCTMQYLVVMFLVAAVQIEAGIIQWKKIDELKASLDGYNKAAEKLFLLTLETMADNKVKALQFIDQLSQSNSLTTSSLNQTSCYKSLFDINRLQRSFQYELIRYQIPLENLIAELYGKLEGINNTINICQDLADSKYSICKVMNTNDSCEEETDMWLEEVINIIRCQFSPACNNHILTKRSAASNCPVGTFVCDSIKCIPPKSVCDGMPDCTDGTDESRCCHHHNHFYCREKDACINNMKLCDGVNDCGERSDESHCGKILMNNCSIEHGMHQCDTMKCIGMEKVCDGNRDCQDGSDEGIQCGMGICPEECTKKGGVCFHGPHGLHCFAQCPLGTFETLEGCSAHPLPGDRTVVELLEEIPGLAYKQNVKFAYLKMKASAELSKMISDVLNCLDPYYPVLNKVLSFPIYNTTDVEPIPPKSVEKTQIGNVVN